MAIHGSHRYAESNAREGNALALFLLCEMNLS
jgi:hypothetical protein